jgi:hypothetical protein
LQKDTTEKLKKKLALMVNRARVYMDYDETEPNIQSQGEKQYVCIGHQDREFVEPLLEEIDRTTLHLETKQTNDSLRIYAFSALTKIPLGSVLAVQHLPVMDNEMSQQSGTFMGIVLQDKHTGSELTLYTLVALARTLDVLKEEQDAWGYNKTDIVEDLLGHSVYQFEPLGETYLAVVNELRRPERSADRKLVHEALVGQLDENFQHDQTGRHLAQRIRERARQTDVLDEKAALEEYLRKLAETLKLRSTSSPPASPPA